MNRKLISPRSKIRFLAVLSVLVASVAVSGCAALGPKHPVGNSTVPQPAKAVDLTRYSGKWFELARYEQSFQKGCEGVSADYTLRADGTIGVLNRCRKPDGKVKEAKGRAKVVDRGTNSKLKVSFFGPFFGDYWILDHADDYRWSLVGEPSGRYLWILHRMADPPEAEREALINRARAMGFDTTMLMRTKQP
jgi:apolipoprotein D and lipocalin family protein